MLQNTSTDHESPNGTPKHSDKFPLTLHRTGQYCKKIRGHMYYFGKDKQKALQAYLEQATYLHTGKGRPVGDVRIALSYGGTAWTSMVAGSISRGERPASRGTLLFGPRQWQP